MIHDPGSAPDNPVRGMSDDAPQNPDASPCAHAPRISEKLRALADALKKRDVTLRELAEVGDESEDALFLLLLLLSLPFCQPIPLAGLSTPFGLAIFAGGRAMAAGRPFRMPARIAAVRVPHTFFPALLRGAARMVGWLERHLRPRRRELAREPGWRRVHGAVIAFWALMLALPLPLPFSNVFSALPIPLLAAALLEDDGVMIIRAYVASALCAAYWIAMIFFGGELIALGNRLLGS